MVRPVFSWFKLNLTTDTQAKQAPTAQMHPAPTNEPVLDNTPQPTLDLYAEEKPPSTVSTAERRGTFVLGLILHGILALAHALLLIAWYRHYEHRASFAFTSFSSTWLPTIITFVSQTIGVVRYLTL